MDEWLMPNDWYGENKPYHYVVQGNKLWGVPTRGGEPTDDLGVPPLVAKPCDEAGRPMGATVIWAGDPVTSVSPIAGRGQFRFLAQTSAGAHYLTTRRP